MISIKFEFDKASLDKIQQSIKKAPQETADALEGAIKKSIVKLANQTVKEAPVNKQTGGGNLRQNIMFGMRSKLSGVVESRAPYSVFVHEGTRPHEIRVKNKKVLANKRTGQVFGQKVNHPGTAPNPFLVRAADRVHGQITKYFEQAVERVTRLLKK